MSREGGPRVGLALGTEDRGFVPSLRRWWVLLLAAAVLSGLVTFAVASTLAPTYEAGARLLTGPTSASFDTLRASGQLARTYAELAASRPQLVAVIDELGLDTTPESLAERVTASSNDVTRIVAIRVRDGDADQAAAIANALTGQLQQLASAPSINTTIIEEVLRQREVFALSEAQALAVRRALARVLRSEPVGQVRVVEPAQPPAEPSSPRVLLLTALGALAGLALVGAIVVIRDAGAPRPVDGPRLARPVSAAEPPTGVLGDVPILGTVSVGRRWRRGAVMESEPRSLEAEGFRRIAALLSRDAEGKTILVTSSDDATASGAVAANIALALSETGLAVVLLDADMARGEATRLLEMGDRPGLSNALMNGGGGERRTLPSLPDSRVRRGSLEIVPSGTSHAVGPIVPALAEATINALRTDPATVIVIASAPVGYSASTVGWAQASELVILATEVDASELAVQQARQSLLNSAGEPPRVLILS